MRTDDTLVISTGDAVIVVGMNSPYTQVGRKIDLHTDVRHMYLIRDRYQLMEEFSEEEVLEHMTANGISADWVDSESDAMAMYESAGEEVLV